MRRIRCNRATPWGLAVVLCMTLGCRAATVKVLTPAPGLPPPKIRPLSPEQLRVARVRDEVSAIRGLPFRRAVPFSRQSRERNLKS